jgi:cysteine-rich repeat protein
LIDIWYFVYAIVSADGTNSLANGNYVFISLSGITSTYDEVSTNTALIDSSTIGRKFTIGSVWNGAAYMIFQGNVNVKSVKVFNGDLPNQNPNCWMTPYFHSNTQNTGMYCAKCFGNRFQVGLDCLNACPYYQDPQLASLCPICPFPSLVQTGSYINCTVCGDAAHTDPEACDDGNNVDNDGCSKDCRIEVNSFC